MKVDSQVISARDLRKRLGEVVRDVRRGASFTVMYRSRPAFMISAPDAERIAAAPLKNDPLYCARAIGRSRDGRSAADHDGILYG